MLKRFAKFREKESVLTTSPEPIQQSNVFYITGRSWHTHEQAHETSPNDLVYFFDLDKLRLSGINQRLNLTLMIKSKRNNIVFKSNLVYILEIKMIILIGMLLLFTLISLHRVNLYLYIFLPIALGIVFFKSRRFYFYSDRIEIIFLYKKEILLFSNIEKIIYKFSGTRDSPVIIIKSSIKKNIYSFLMYRFVLDNLSKVSMLLKFAKENNIPIEIKSSEYITKKINDKIQNDSSKW